MKSDQSLSRLESNVANTLVEYLEGLQSKDWAVPGEDGMFDQKFTLWLSGSSWIPLGVILESDESELSGRRVAVCTGFDAAPELSKHCKPRRARGPVMSLSPSRLALIAAARDLGTSFGNYPEPATMRARHA